MYFMRIENRIFNIDRIVDVDYRPAGKGESGEGLQSRVKMRFAVTNEWDKELEPYEVVLFGSEAEDAWGSINAVMLSGGVAR